MKKTMLIFLIIFAMLILLIIFVKPVQASPNEFVLSNDFSGILLPTGNDVFYDNPERMLSATGSSQPGYDDTSVYMLGSVAVRVVFVESNGTIDLQTENWTQTEKDLVMADIQEGLITKFQNSWAPAGMGLSFTISSITADMGYEPINRSSTDESLWINQIMQGLGVSGVNYRDRVRNYDNSLRNSYGTKWAFTIFVIDNSASASGTFSNGLTAYSYLRGPFLVITYRNCGGVGFGWVVAHETAHVFSAADQYYNPATGNGCTSTTTQYGYLGIVNSNCEYNNPSANVYVLMNKVQYPPDITTEQQIGWRDQDSDSVQDPVDTSPTISLSPYSPDPTTMVNLSFSGIAYDQPWPHASCNYPNECYFYDVTINTIISVQYRVDGGAWQNASAVDGAYTTDYEPFTFSTGALSYAAHVVEVKTTNSLGRQSAIWSDTVTIQPPPSPGAFNKTGPSNGATGQSLSPTLTWGNSSGATGYEYCYDTSNDNACSSWMSNGSSTSKALAGLAYSTTYYWHVRAVNANGTTYANGSSTAFWSFTTQANNPGNGTYYQHFSTDVIGSGEWIASNASVTINTTDGYLNIAVDGSYDAYAAKSFSYSLPLMIETRVRLTTGGAGYLLPWITLMTDTSNIGVTYNSDLGWAFNEFTNVKTKAATEGNWTTIKMIIRPSGGELWAKNDGDATYTKITTAPWTISSLTGIRVTQPWDSNCQMDFIRIAKIQTKTFTSVGSYDGWILETTEKSNRGGQLDASASSLFVGDSASRQQYRSVLSFATATLPDTAAIMSVRLKVRRQGVVGTNPLTTHKPLMYDIRKPYIGTGLGLASGDFQAVVQYTGGTFSPNLVSGWYTATLKSAAYAFINKVGVTQFRLRFKLDDDNDAVADILKLYSGNSTTSAYRPQLVVEYYVP